MKSQREMGEEAKGENKRKMENRKGERHKEKSWSKDQRKKEMGMWVERKRAIGACKGVWVLSGDSGIRDSGAILT